MAPTPHINYTCNSFHLQGLQAEFKEFDIGDSCETDKLLVDGSGLCDFESPIVHCGDRHSQPIKSSENILCLRFTSAMLDHTTGFQISVTFSGKLETRYPRLFIYEYVARPFVL